MEHRLHSIHGIQLILGKLIIEEQPSIQTSFPTVADKWFDVFNLIKHQQQIIPDLPHLKKKTHQQDTHQFSPMKKKCAIVKFWFHVHCKHQQQRKWWRLIDIMHILAHWGKLFTSWISLICNMHQLCSNIIDLTY